MRLVALRRLAHILNGGTPTSDSENWDGSISWATPADLSSVDGSVITKTSRTLTELGVETGSTAVPRNSILLSTRAPIGYTALTAKTMAFNQGCKGIVPKTDVLDSGYLQYALQHLGPSLQSLGQGSTFVELNTHSLSAVRVPTTDLMMQRRIAEFLDRETAEIDAFIADQHRLEYLTAEHIDAYSEDLIWSSDVRHVRLKYLSNVLTGFPFKSNDFVDPHVGNTKLLRGVNVDVGHIDWSEPVSIPSTFSRDYADYLLHEGDLVLGLDRPLIRRGLRLATISSSDTDSLLVQRVARIRGNRDLVSNDWIREALLSSRFRAYLEPDFTGVSVPHMSPKQLMEFRIPLPDPSSQRGIIEGITKARLEHRALRGDIGASITLSKERRSALISAAVTGQIDVSDRYAAEKVYEEVESST